jgi:APA family basic amino acid/polyamine antiporter
MIGAGVFLSAGFMARTMGPGPILWAWVVGLVLALAGAVAYAAVARLVPHSGGEYRYLSDLLHPGLGYLAGWASLLVGYAAPVAVNVLGAAGFLGTLTPMPDERIVATAFVVVLTAIHAVGMRTSRRTQDALAGLKVVLVVGFVVLGLVLGARALPTWIRPPGQAGATLGGFVQSQFFIAFAFSGWNAAIYVADEFRAPRRDVGRSMLIGCVGVGLLYLAVNFVLVANVSVTEAAAVVGAGGTTTLGHVVATTLLGPGGGTAMSFLALIALLSAASAMTYVGPRIYASMARDGYLPRILEGRPDRPPTGSVVLQGVLTIAIVWAQGLQSALSTAGALLVLFASLTCASLFKVALRPGGRPRPSPIALVAAAINVVVGGWMVYYGLRDEPAIVAWCAAAAAGALITYVATRAHARRVARGG